MTIRGEGFPGRRDWVPLVIICVLAIVQGAAAVHIATGSVTIGAAGEAASVPIVLDTAPEGIHGYRMTVALSDPSVADISDVAFPDWAELQFSSSLPGDRVVLLAAVDLGEAPAGAPGVPLVTLTVTGRKSGITGIGVVSGRNLSVRDRSGLPYTVDVSSGVLTVADSATLTPSEPSYAQARAAYEVGGQAWSRAWAASDLGLIRQYLVEARGAYTDCLAITSAVRDPANEANLALLGSISTAYIDLADAALAMYDGADVEGGGRLPWAMTREHLAWEASCYATAAEEFERSAALFTRATSTLQTVSYAGTEYGDGTAYTAVIVPLLDGKAAYVGEFARYEQGWYHTALAYAARMDGDEETFRAEATAAMDLFDGLRSSEAFGAQAASNHDTLAALLNPPTPMPTPTPFAGPTISSGTEVEPGLYRFSAEEVEAVRDATPREYEARESGLEPNVWQATVVEPTEILAYFPRLTKHPDYRLGAFVINAGLSWEHWVFAVPPGRPMPSPSGPADADAWIDPDFMRYIQGEETPAGYLEAALFRIQADGFGEWWHTNYWSDLRVLGERPPAWETYADRAPEPAIWAPTVRVSSTEARVTLHLFSTIGPSTGVWEVTEVLPRGSFDGERTVVRIAEVPVTVVY